MKGAFRNDVSEAALSVGRGNGKTTLVAGLGAAGGRWASRSSKAETLLVASSFEQGRISFEHILAFLRERHGAELDNKSKWRIWDTAQQARISNRSNGATVRCLGSDPRRAHGAAPTLSTGRTGSMARHVQRQDVSGAQDGAGKQPMCRLIALGTLPADKEHWFAKMLSGGADYLQLHEAGRMRRSFRRGPGIRLTPACGICRTYWTP